MEVDAELRSRKLAISPVSSLDWLLMARRGRPRVVWICN